MTEGERVILDLIESGFLRIDDDGSIWRLQTRTSTGRVLPLPEPIRADREDRHYVGYRSVRARINGREFAASAHRIVLIAKGEPLPDGPPRGPIDPEVEDRIVALTKQGVSAPQIAEMVRVSVRCVQRARKGAASVSHGQPPANSLMTTSAPPQHYSMTAPLSPKPPGPSDLAQRRSINTSRAAPGIACSLANTQLYAIE